jgi:hypothetical protein
VAVIVQIDGSRFASAAIPLKDEPPSFVDADGVEALKIVAQLFEVVAGRDPKILIRGRVIDHLNLSEQPGFQIGGDFFDGRSSTKKSRSQSSRKLTIIPRLQS